MFDLKDLYKTIVGLNSIEKKFSDGCLIFKIDFHMNLFKESSALDLVENLTFIHTFF
jgi:hypothetical protein